MIRAASRLPLPRRRVLLALAGAAACLAAGHAAAGPAPKRVLIVHSFGREVAPADAVTATFRRELASQLPGPVVFLEAALDANRSIGPDETAAFVAYLHARFGQPVPDLIVASSSPAAMFVVRHREALFPGVPLLLTALDARLAPLASLQPGDAAVASRIDLIGRVNDFLRVRPATRSIAVVVGDTPLERFWRRELERELAPLAGRVELIWLDKQSLEEMKKSVAALPSDAAVFFAILVADAAGVPHERIDALLALKKVSPVPIFSLYESEIGQGVIGGPFYSQSRSGREAARIALRQLSGKPAAAVEVVDIDVEPALYDGRELARWHIDEALLPPGSEVHMRPPSPWAQYSRQIIAVSVLVAVQTALIGALLVQRARRRRAESEARMLGGRLITAHEDEGRRLARELHDDITQRLAGLSIEAATLGRRSAPAERAAAEQAISSELASLSRDVHALSYRLHPTVVEDLGLGEALRIECDRTARRGSVAVAFDSDAGGAALKGEPALCLFRVAQEALRNAVRHAQPRRIEVALRAEDGGTALQVADDGRGFDPALRRERVSLGLESMRERVVLLGGRLQIHSRPGQGTQISAWLPAGAAA